MEVKWEGGMIWYMTSLKNLGVLGSDGLGLLVSLCIHSSYGHVNAQTTI